MSSRAARRYGSGTQYTLLFLIVSTESVAIILARVHVPVCCQQKYSCICKPALQDCTENRNTKTIGIVRHIVLDIRCPDIISQLSMLMGVPAAS